MILNFLILLAKNGASMELLNIAFENSLPQGFFGGIKDFLF